MSREPMPDPLAEPPNWTPHPPRPVVPLPALNHDDLRGRRVIVGLPGLGWRYDLRADEKVIQGSRTYIPVIPEHEWYKAELEQIEVFAPLVPAERVWVETLNTNADAGSPANIRPIRFASLDAPPRRNPVPAADALHVTGQRVVHVVDAVERRDLRAVTELYTNTDSEICLRVATELEWYRWAWSGQPPRTTEASIDVVWLE